MEAFARSIDVEMGLTRFVEWWNAPAAEEYFSLIGSFSQFEEALAMDADRWDAYMDIRVAGGFPERPLSRAIERRLTPTIDRTFAVALSARADAWAAAIVVGGSSSRGLRKPFAEVSDFVNYCLRHVKYPMIASPQGTDEFSRRILRPWLARSLAKLSREAAEVGWIAKADLEADEGRVQ